MRQGLSVAICGLLLPILAGCTGTTVRPSNTQQTVPKTYTVAVVGEITANDELWHAYTIEARRQLISELNESQAFGQILESAPPPGGHAVTVGISAMTVRAQYSPFQMVFTEKTVSGTYYGSVRPNLDFPILVDHYMNKKLNIDGLISRTYKLDDINEGFKRMLAGEVARGVVVFD